MSRRGNGPASSVGSSAGSVASAGAATSPVDGRKRQNKRDEAIRRKVETEISKRKNPVGKTTKATKRRTPGTVLALKPSPPLTMKFHTSIHEAAQFMSAKRENCVLVIDADDSICGIFTAKDIAFKIVGSGADVKSHTIEDIMTPNPLCARTDTSATEALNLMVSKGFRHLPVMDEDHNIAGVLDITKCFYEAMEKLERAYQSSRKLHDALEGVQSELGSSQPAEIISYVEALKQQTEGPDLESVLDGQEPVFVDARTSVSDAAKLMKQRKTTAVLVTDQDTIVGIFTTKDVVLRVIAAGHDPKTCSVVRVMTPQPDFANKSLSIQAALRQMHDGHYLNLPVMNDDSEIVGIVDVLKLTYATLSQINNMNGSGAGTDGAEGPAWNKFWMSLDDSESVHSDGNGSGRRSSTPLSSLRHSINGAPDVSASELAQFNLGSEVGPNDSISRMEERADERMPSISGVLAKAANYPFKFKSPNGRTYRVAVSEETGIAGLRQMIVDKFSAKEIADLGGEGVVEDGKVVSQGFAISYIDDEADAVTITTTQDLVDAVELHRKLGLEKGDLFIHHPEESVDASAETVASLRKTARSSNEIITGIPNEVLLPGAIAALAASIILAFTLSKR